MAEITNLPGVYEWHTNKWVKVTMYEHHNGTWCRVHMLDYRTYEDTIEALDNTAIEDHTNIPIIGVYSLKEYGALIESLDGTPLLDTHNNKILGLYF